MGYTFITISYKENINEKDSDIINKDTEYKIYNCFRWKGYSVHLDKENQMNYKNAFDLAIATDGKNLPVTFKFKKGKNTAYYTFDTIDELKDFVSGAVEIELRDGMFRFYRFSAT